QLDIPIPTIDNITSSPNFSDLNQIEPKLFRRGKIGGWQDEMPLDLHNLFWEYHGEAMREVGYSRQNELSDINLKLDLSKFPEDIQKLINQYENLLNQNEKTIQDLKKELIRKEETIQDLIAFRRFSLRYWDLYYLRPFLKKTIPQPLIRLIKALKNQTNKLTLAHQYPPRPLQIPKSYYSQSSSFDLPSISLVTPSYNHAKFIDRTITSILEQNYPSLEYIIQDGASTDDTLKILDKYCSQTIQIKSQADTGQANAINRGFSQTTGEIMAWLNSDDLLLPGTLFYIANYFHKHPDVDVVYGHRILINEQDEEIGRWVLPPHDNDVLLWADYIPQETLFWRRELWEKVGGSVDESFRFAMDWDLLLRFQAVGAKFVRLPRFLGAFRVYPQQKTQGWEAIGTEEMNHLRSRCHDRTVSQLEIELNIKPYLKKSWLYYQLAHWGILV
ncbi:glycosyltransferase family 2 protein, partial [Spirulina sp. 06S082]|uniref:glycosyltransferase family 2 protein n=1 Tax=Spirulina sp. 06S082 TaxID=3110248 RepID=UPI002B220968